MTDSEAELQLQVAMSSNSGACWIKPPKQFTDYRAYNYGVVTRKGAYLVFNDKHPTYSTGNNSLTVNPPVPAKMVPESEWFDYYLRTRGATESEEKNAGDTLKHPGKKEDAGNPGMFQKE